MLLSFVSVRAEQNAITFLDNTICLLLKNRKSVVKINALLLYFGTRAYLFSLDEGLCYSFFTRNNGCEFLTSYGVIFQSDFQS